MSEKIKSKDLSYDHQNLPPFLQRLRAQNAGHRDASRHEREIARPRKAHAIDQEDEPTIVDESGDLITQTELDSRNAFESATKTEAAAAAPEAQADDAKEPRRSAAVTAIATKKRKIAKVVGEDSADNAAEDSKPVAKAVKATKKKSKPIKLAFDNDEALRLQSIQKHSIQPAAVAQSTSVDEAYTAAISGTPILSTANTKGSWLARVSHRASHIPNRPLASPNSITSSTSTASASASRETLPLRRAAATAGNPRRSSLGATTTTTTSRTTRPASSSANSPALSPPSPVDSDFETTPIDATFGDRTATPPDRNTSVSATAAGIAGEQGALSPQHPPQTTQMMNKYAKQAGDASYDSDADADDEFERSMVGSPMIQADDQSDHPSESEEETESVDGQDTPTTQGWAEQVRSPRGNIEDWTESDVGDFLVTLSPQMKQYKDTFIEEVVDGKALVALQHEELRELGVQSVGHRLTILKAVYEQKLKDGVKINDGDYVPLSAEGDKADLTATQDDIARIIESIRLRDQRIIAAEAELRAMKQDLDRIMDDNRKLREETLPVMRLVKDQRTPLPDPAVGNLPSPRNPEPVKEIEVPVAAPAPKESKASSLSRKFSTKKLFLGSAPKQPSPTHATVITPSVRDDGGTHLEASAAAVAASSHLTASMTSQPSPNGVTSQPLSPTSPAYSAHPNSAGSHHTATSANPRASTRTHYDDPGSSWTSNASTMVDGQLTSARLQERARRQAPTPSPRDDETPSSARDSKDNPAVEIFKSFRVSIEDPCEVVLPVALKRYNIHDDWRQYSLYIVHGDQERCLGLKEKPLLLFKQLDREGRKPMFMLRRHASPQDGWTGHVNGGERVSSKIPGGVL